MWSLSLISRFDLTPRRRLYSWFLQIGCPPDAVNLLSAMTSVPSVVDLLVPPRRGLSLWHGIKGIPGSMQLVDIARLRHTWAYGYIVDGLKLLAAGAVIDACRRAFVWLYNRFKFRTFTQNIPSIIDSRTHVIRRKFDERRVRFG